MTFTASQILSRTLGIGQKANGKCIKTCSLYQLHADDRYLAKMKMKTRLGLRLGSNYSHARMLVSCYDEIKKILSYKRKNKGA